MALKWASKTRRKGVGERIREPWWVHQGRACQDKATRHPLLAHRQLVSIVSEDSDVFGVGGRSALAEGRTL